MSFNAIIYNIIFYRAYSCILYVNAFIFFFFFFNSGILDMGRTPCCDKQDLKRGSWTEEEDQKLVSYIRQHGEGGWRYLPEKAGLYSIIFPLEFTLIFTGLLLFIASSTPTYRKEMNSQIISQLEYNKQIFLKVLFKIFFFYPAEFKTLL